MKTTDCTTCRKCWYWSKWTHSCDYALVNGVLRGCRPGKDCYKFIPRKHHKPKMYLPDSETWKLYNERGGN